MRCGNTDRRPRTDADDLDVRDGVDALDDVLEMPVRKHERVAPAEQHVTDLR